MSFDSFSEYASPVVTSSKRRRSETAITDNTESSPAKITSIGGLKQLIEHSMSNAPPMNPLSIKVPIEVNEKSFKIIRNFMEEDKSLNNLAKTLLGYLS